MFLLAGQSARLTRCSGSYQTSSPLFSKATFSVLRRYSDFLWLYETLSMNNPGVVVPPAPEKNPFGRFDEQFVQQRRSALEKCIQKMANHPVLCKDPDLKFFLENDNFTLDVGPFGCRFSSVSSSTFFYRSSKEKPRWLTRKGGLWHRLGRRWLVHGSMKRMR